ncbi:hypothetical protein PM082_023766 [Marasmius tenuissimus]|nr:hypothetical protein PM082_023766 [Marasmius tenuissimus]
MLASFPWLIGHLGSLRETGGQSTPGMIVHFLRLRSRIDSSNEGLCVQTWMSPPRRVWCLTSAQQLHFLDLRTNTLQVIKELVTLCCEELSPRSKAHFFVSGFSPSQLSQDTRSSLGFVGQIRVPVSHEGERDSSGSSSDSYSPEPSEHWAAVYCIRTASSKLQLAPQYISRIGNLWETMIFGCESVHFRVVQLTGITNSSEVCRFMQVEAKWDGLIIDLVLGSSRRSKGRIIRYMP